MTIPKWLANTLKGCGCLIVILLVIAILFPIPTASREKARLASCMSNEKQIGIALAEYEQDNNECIPDIANAPGNKNTWRTAVYAYLKNVNTFQCPSRDDKTFGPDGYPRSYAANYSGDYRGGSKDKGEGAFAGPGSQHITLTEVKDPSSLITVCEVERSNSPEFNINAANLFGPGKHILWAGHKNHTVFLFADGHVKQLAPTQTAAFSAWNLWYRDGKKPLSPTSLAILKEAEDRGDR